MSIILFILILAFLIFVHELGHFIVAKKSGVRVDEFAIGFPPKIFGWKRGETSYVLNLIPFGGYVKIFGENPDEDSIAGPDKSRSFVNAKKWKQALILVAGISFNLIAAWILLSISFMSGLTTSVQDSYAKYAHDPHVLVTYIQKDSPASKAGIIAGDRIISLQSGQILLATSSLSIASVQKTVGESGGIINLVLQSPTATSSRLVNVEAKEGTVAGKKMLGIGMDMVGTVKLPFFIAFGQGAKLTAYMVKDTAVGLAVFAYDAFRGHGDFSQVTGPVGIVGLVGEAQKLGIIYLLSFTAFISINLAVINLIPFPALDGGRLLFVAIEAVTRRQIPVKVANVLNTIGFLLLILLMVVVSVKDVIRLF
jgi:regulator of sigma E protease